MTAKPATMTIRVGEDGSVKTDFCHFAGRTCDDVGRQLHALLAAEWGINTAITHVTPKPEWFASSTQQIHTQMLQQGESADG